MIDLEPIKQRLAAATPGPWKTGATATRFEVNCRGAQVRTEALTPDLALIANAPTDLAALVAEVERLTVEAAVRQQDFDRLATNLLAVKERLKESQQLHDYWMKRAMDREVPNA